jgi:choline dehydrogenase-like flavoprotein
VRIYIAGKGDTLRSIAQKYQISLDHFISINQHVLHPDQKIAGVYIHIPSHNTTVRSCPYPSTRTNEWIPITSLEKMAETKYDVLIVGTGAGGGAVLWRLCEQWRKTGKRIGVVEAGNLLLPTHSWNIPTMNPERQVKYFLENAYPIGKTLPEFSGAEIVYALGGRTIFWGTVSPRIHASEFLDWPISYREMELYYNIAERVMNVTKAYTSSNSMTQVLLNRLWANDFPEASDIPLAADLKSTSYGQIHSNVFFSSILFLARALNQHSFDLAVNAHAVNVLTENGVSTGVKVMTPEKKSFTLKAKTIVLAIGTLETPRLLLYSKIPGKAIGHYLTSHSFLKANGTLDTKHFPEVLGSLGILMPQTNNHPYQIQIGGAPGGYFWYHYEEKPIKKVWDIGFFGAFGKVESRYENKIRLDPINRDEYGVPEIQVDFSYSSKDQVIIHQMATAMKRAALVTNIQLTSGIDLMPPGLDYHEFGTCRMGIDPSTSVTNPDGQIHGISNLYVADNSVLPSIGASNPTLTTVALSIRTADRIIKNMR